MSIMLCIESFTRTTCIVCSRIAGLAFADRLFFLPKSFLRIYPSRLFDTLSGLSTVYLSNVFGLKSSVFPDKSIDDALIIIFIISFFLFTIFPLELTMSLAFIPILTINTCVVKPKLFALAFIRPQRFPFTTATGIPSDWVYRIDINLHLFDLRYTFSLFHMMSCISDIFELDFLN